ncbi:hypothetical protein D5085_00140 [Ectothiorhodospiraceae bacterium BW-2]|nr:hypothetical protein D5085_00140 [Ectothiorhodospiraceae bacterium BW-2]
MNFADKELFLRHHPLLHHIPVAIADSVIEQFEWAFLAAGETLVREGDENPVLAILHTGRLTIYREGRPIGALEETAIIGEISLIGQQRAAATLIAERDSLMLCIGKQPIEALMLKHSALALQLAQLSVNRLTGANESSVSAQPLSTNIALLPLEGPLEWQSRFCDNLLTHFPNAQLISKAKAEEHLGFEIGTSLSPRQQQQLTLWIGELQRTHSHLLWLTTTARDLWGEMGVRQATQILYLADPLSKPRLTPLEQAIWDNPARAATQSMHLILYNSTADELRRSAIDWLAPRRLSTLLSLQSYHAKALQPVAALTAQKPLMIQRLSRYPLLATLQPQQLQSVASYFTEKSLPAGSTLCCEGEQTDSLYLVESGRFSALKEGRSVAEFYPGEVIGEIGLLTQTPRSATLRAERCSTVLEMTRADFERLTAQIPQLSQRMSQLLCWRLLQKKSRAPLEFTMTIALIPVVAEDPRQQQQFQYLSNDFTRSLQQLHDTLAIRPESVNQLFGHNTAQLPLQAAGSTLLSGYITQQEALYPLVLLIGDFGATHWNERIIRQADRVVLVSHHDAGPRLSAVERELQPILDTLDPPPELAILQPQQATEGRGTANWLTLRKLNNHHHIRIGSSADSDRAARMVTGHAIGLVLSGVSSRAIAHVGVVRALEDSQIPIDCISGSSSGSGIAGAVILDSSWRRAREIALFMIRHAAPSLRKFTLPYTSLLSGQDADTLLRQNYGDGLLEDQFIRCIPVAADIKHGQLVEIRKGPIWKAIRTSTSLPVIWPPVIDRDNDQVLVDGGLIDNVPAATLYSYCQHGWTLISDSNPASLPFEGVKPYGTVVSGWRVLWDKLRGRVDPEGHYPALMEVVGHAMCMESYRNARNLQQGANPRILSFNIVVPFAGLFGIKDINKSLQMEEFTYQKSLEIIANNPQIYDILPKESP